jgi:hypothetical protein
MNYPGIPGTIQLPVILLPLREITCTACGKKEIIVI